MVRRSRSAFTLVELLVVIAIIGILAGLLLPAVQSARESARRAECGNKQRQLAMAAIGFEGRKGRFPGYQELLLPNPASPYPSPYNKPASWAVMMLADLDRQELADRWRDPTVNILDPILTLDLDVMRCPSTSGRGLISGETSYVANAGFMWRPNDPDLYPPAANPLEAAQRPANGVFLDRINLPQAACRASDFRDGKPSTILFSENLLATVWYQVGPLDPTVLAPQIGAVPAGMPGTTVIPNGRFGTTFVWCYASEPLPPSGLTHDAPPLVPPAQQTPVPQAPPAPWMKINGQKLNFEPGEIYNAGAAGMEWARPSSFHPGGVVVAFADGRTQFLNEEIAYFVYQQLMTPYGTQSDMPLRRGYLLRDQDYQP